MWSKQKFVDFINSLENVPIAIQAIWNNNPDGWVLKLKTENNSSEIENTLGESSNEDAKITETFSWLEINFIEELIKTAKHKFDIPFYFPSNNPNFNRSNWRKKNNLTECNICTNLVLSQSICQSCQLEKELNNYANGNKGIVLVTLTEEQITKNHFYNFSHTFFQILCSKLKYFHEGYQLLKFLKPKAYCQLQRPMILFWKNVVEGLLQYAIDSYEEQDSQLSMTKEICFGGKTREIQIFFQEGKYIYFLSNFLNLLKSALQKNSCLYIIGNGDVSKKDLECLLFLRKQKKHTLINKVKKKYFFSSKFMINSLQQNRCIQIRNSKVELTLKGRVVDIAGKKTRVFLS